MTLSRVWVTRRDTSGKPTGWGRSETAGRKWKPSEIAGALLDNGFPDQSPQLAEMVATVLAESNGYAKARLVYTTESGIPLRWSGAPVKVNRVPPPKPDEKTEPSAYDQSVRWMSDRGPYQLAAENISDQDAADLEASSRIAIGMYERRGFTPWAAHNHDRHVPRMREAIKGVANDLARRYSVRPFWS